jgi:large subunit ribosomal protein L29
MALLKMKELRAMRPDDIKAKMKELSDELMHERGIAAMGGAPASPGKIRAIRTNVARIHTVRREVELAKLKAPADKKTEKKEAERKPTTSAKPKKKAEKVSEEVKNEEEKK